MSNFFILIGTMILPYAVGNAIIYASMTGSSKQFKSKLDSKFSGNKSELAN